MRTAVSNKVTAKPVTIVNKKVAPQKPTATPIKKREVKPSSIAIATSKTPADLNRSKQSQLISLLKNPQGADIKKLMQATGWQAHSVRAFISGTIKKKLGLNLISQKQDGVQIYKLATDDLNHP